MLIAFENYVKKNKLFSKQDKLLLAVSGGEDSICLFHLLLATNYRFSVAHCNFQLRGAESDKDEAFVKSLAKAHQVPYFGMRFDTKKEAKKLKNGTQETARKLRYDWFHELLETYRFDKLLTAHHQGDNSETMIINLLRSTGISGLHGIPVKLRHTVRPLMFTNRDKISRFVSKNSLKFRLDKSNLTDDYLRNQIRHHILPELKKIEPEIDQVLFSVSAQVMEFEQLAFELIEKEWEAISVNTAEGISLPFNNLHRINNLEAFLYYKLKGYGFNKSQVEMLKNIEHAQVGKKIDSKDWIFTKERDAYILQQKQKKIEDPVSVKIKSSAKSLVIEGLELDFKKISPPDVDYSLKGLLYLDISSNPFPITIRTWEKGDKMQPFGMKGSKKISDILTDKKVDHTIRHQQLVILDKEDKIIALLPDMISDIRKITKKTIKVLSIHLKTPLFAK